MNPLIRLEILTIDPEIQLQTFLVRLSEWNVAAMLKVAAHATDFLTLNVSTTLAYVSWALLKTMEYANKVGSGSCILSRSKTLRLVKTLLHSD